MIELSSRVIFTCSEDAALTSSEKPKFMSRKQVEREAVMDHTQSRKTIAFQDSEERIKPLSQFHRGHARACIWQILSAPC